MQHPVPRLVDPDQTLDRDGDLPLCPLAGSDVFEAAIARERLARPGGRSGVGPEEQQRHVVRGDRSGVGHFDGDGEGRLAQGPLPRRDPRRRGRGPGVDVVCQKGRRRGLLCPGEDRAPPDCFQFDVEGGVVQTGAVGHRRLPVEPHVRASQPRVSRARPEVHIRRRDGFAVGCGILRDRQPASRRRASEQQVEDGPAAGLAGVAGPEDGVDGGVGEQLGVVDLAPAELEHDDGLAERGDGPEEVQLGVGPGQRAAVAGLGLEGVVDAAREDDDIRGAGRVHRPSERGVVVVFVVGGAVDPAARGVGDDVRPEEVPGGLVRGDEVRRGAEVVALHLRGGVGPRADEGVLLSARRRRRRRVRGRGRGRRQGQRAVVLEEHGALDGGPVGERPRLVGVHVVPRQRAQRLVPGRVEAADGHEGGVQPRQGGVDLALGDEGPVPGRLQGVGAGGRVALEVGAGLHGPGGGVGEVRGVAVAGDHEGHAVAVGRDVLAVPVPPPVAPEDVPQEVGVGAEGRAVDAVVAAHEGPDAAPLDGARLEGREVVLGQVLGGDVGVEAGAVDAVVVFKVVGRVVLAGRDDSLSGGPGSPGGLGDPGGVPFEACEHGGDVALQVKGVLAGRLLASAPTGIFKGVDIGRLEEEEEDSDISNFPIPGPPAGSAIRGGRDEG
ncbi:hypothetical protein CTA1_3417 [Colletotrichum tanaceti]|uniref:Uncharacterized protein n=1 Tax=Colletotrichum tanaceti TaxID=1306861 RepID=A0A4U6XGH6_9PEZI|nr:hypothetical protein CTA1_3417 [Colletotrichum tanaceti]